MLKLVILLAVAGIGFAAELEEVFAWNDLEFVWPSPGAKDDAIKSGSYIPANNLPLGLDRWHDKLFVTVPRWKAGVASSLNYIPLSNANKTAPLIPYPDWKANTLPGEGEDRIISTFRVSVDPCDRLWVMDTGLADILGSPNQIAPPALVVFDLKTDKLIRRYTFKPTDIKEASFFVNVVLDVNPDKCEDAYAYVPDLGGYGIIVYSWGENESWRVKHNYFYFDPLKGDLTVGGVNFQWTDGVFGLALTEADKEGFRTLYFHALAGIREFSVSTEVLRNKTIATDPHNYHLFKVVGERGDGSQSSASVFDEKSGVLFLTQLTKDGVACWNSKKQLNSENLGTVAKDAEKLIFTNDIKIDSDRNLWVISDRMPTFIYKSLDPKEVNYRIFKIKVDDAIANTPCAN